MATRKRTMNKRRKIRGGWTVKGNKKAKGYRSKKSR
jgi:hypothetical protein